MAVHVVDHPLVRHKLGILRKDSTSTSEFRSVSNEIARLLIYEATKGFATEKHTVQGWAGPVEVEVISGKMVTIVPILRAGLGLMDGVLDMIPGAKISVVGLYRNEETLEPVEYYAKLARNIESRLAIILDPMLATGGSMELGLKAFETKGIPGKVHLCSAIASRKGVDYLTETFKDTDYTLWCGAIDPELNDHMYIVPGLGDAGDLAYGGKL